MKLEEIFKTKKPIIGMIHLAGSTRKEKTSRALEELSIYEEQGVDGAIIEDYHGEMHDVYTTLEKASKQNYNITLGLNVLRNPYLGLNWANKFGAKFVQFDNVQSNYISPKAHEKARKQFSNINLFGGIGFKYTQPSGKTLEEDLGDGRKNCDTIVTTGDGTGIETPIEKLKSFKNYLQEFPLIVGAGVNHKNCYEQLQIVEGAIIGSAFKPKQNTQLPLDKFLVKDLMEIVKEVRKNEI